MNKYEFLAKMSKSLENLPKDEIKERLDFYAEMIDDGIEEGLTEEEAVAKLGVTDEPVNQKKSEFTSAPKAEKRKLKTWEIGLLAAGSPLWLSLAIAALSITFSVYVSVWVCIVSLWAVFASLAGAALGTVFLAVYSVCEAKWISGIALIGVFLICTGLSILAFYGCKLLTKYVIIFTKKLFKRRKSDE